jgi:hypothetical protein
MQLVPYFRRAACEMKVVLLDFSGAGLPIFPGARSLPGMKGRSRDWPWLRMQALHRDGYRCRRCGRPGDEITLRVCQMKAHGEPSHGLTTLCASCHSHDENLARALPSLQVASD